MISTSISSRVSQKIGDKYIQDKDLVLDNKLHLLIQEKQSQHISLSTPPGRKIYLEDIEERLQQYPTASVAQQTYGFSC